MLPNENDGGGVIDRVLALVPVLLPFWQPRSHLSALCLHHNHRRLRSQHNRSFFFVFHVGQGATDEKKGLTCNENNSNPH